jgi:hypothetical protein
VQPPAVGINCAFLVRLLFGLQIDYSSLLF